MKQCVDLVEFVRSWNHMLMSTGKALVLIWSNLSGVGIKTIRSIRTKIVLIWSNLSGVGIDAETSKGKVHVLIWSNLSGVGIVTKSLPPLI